jgi:hypothetical protein
MNPLPKNGHPYILMKIVFLEVRFWGGLLNNFSDYFAGVYFL